ncbi:MAG: MFS transporter [Sphingobium sp.]
MMTTSERRDEWKAGWPAVVAGLIGAAAAQIHFATIGVLIRPMSHDLGWSNSAITVGIMICSIVAVPGTPFAGFIAQRLGLARVILIGLPLFLASFGALGLLSFTRAQWITGWVLIALMSVFTKPNLWMLWAAQRFDAARGMAFAAIMSGAGVLAVVSPTLTQISVETFGWRATFPIMAAAMAVIAIPIAIVGFRLCPALPGEASRNAGQESKTAAGMSIGQVIGNRHFWQIGFISFLIGAGLISLQVHIVPMFEARGLAPRVAAMVAGAFGGAALIGRFAGGALLDRYPAKIIGMISLLLPGLGCALFLMVTINAATAFVVAVLMGLGVGAEGDVLGYVTSRYFGVRSFGTVYGAISGLFALGAGTGPFGMSLLLDHLGSYSLVMPMLLIAILFCAFLFATLGTYPRFGETQGLRHKSIRSGEIVPRPGRDEFSGASPSG